MSIAPKQPGVVTLTEQVIALARRPGGMASCDLPGYSVVQVSQAANRLAKDGRIHVSRAHSRKMRFFGTADEAAAHMAAAKNAACRSEVPHAWRGVRQFAKLAANGADPTIDYSRAKHTIYKIDPGARHAQDAGPRLPSDPPFVARTGSMEFAAHPSRCGNQLSYPDGRVETVE